jgi:general secretion pathway protein K
MSGPARTAPPREGGAALIVALWALLMLALLVGGLAYDMNVEAGITSYYRKRLKAQYLAQAGVEWAKMVLAKSYALTHEDDTKEDDLTIAAVNLARAVAVNQRKIPLGDGFVLVDILPEQGRYNVNRLDDSTWEEILDYGGVPAERWPELIDCFNDWVDDNDAHLLNGAESDDPFYTKRNYRCKNAPLDVVNELLLIKGFSDRLVYGGPADKEGDPPYRGIAQSLTTWGDGRINVNTASRDVLMTLPGMDDLLVSAILEQRKGPDGETGTRDDGFENVDEFMAIAGIDPAVRDKVTTSERKYIRVVSIGEVGGVRSGIWSVLLGEQSGVVPVFWREELMP